MKEYAAQPEEMRENLRELCRQCQDILCGFSKQYEGFDAELDNQRDPCADDLYRDDLIALKPKIQGLRYLLHEELLNAERRTGI